MLDYEPYLDGHVWPSESGGIDKDVIYMPPQYAASALHKLVKWARMRSHSSIEEQRLEDEVRSTVLAQGLAAKALSIDDFTPSSYFASAESTKKYPHEPERVLSRLITIALYQYELTSEMDPDDVASLAMGVANRIYRKGYALVKPDAE